MATKMTRRSALFLLILLRSLWAADKTVTDARKALPAAPAIYAEGPSDAYLRDYAMMLKAYVVPITIDQPVMIEVDHISDQTGAKEVPTDASQWVRSVLERIGLPFSTYRTWPSIADSVHSNVLLGSRPDHPKPPPPSFRLVGILSGYKETLVKSKNGKLAATFGGGHTSTDIQAQLEKIRTITTLSISLTLERPDTVAVPGTTVDYQIDIAKDEKSRSIGLFVGGSGIGLGAKLTVSQSTSDMIREAIAMAVIHMTGVVFQVPYYRSSEAFQRNEALDRTVRMTFAGLADPQIEDCIRRFLFLAGKPVNASGPITDADRAVLRREISTRGLADNYGGRVTMAMELWGGLDYHKAAGIVDDLLVARQRQLNEAAIHTDKKPPSQSAPDSSQAAEKPTAADFGWPPFARFVVLDVSGIADSALRSAVFQAAQTAKGCFEVRTHQNPALLGLRLSSSPAEVEKALKRSRLRIRYGWAAPGRLVVSPVQ